MVVAQPEVSPYLYQFLLSGAPGAKKEKKATKAGLRPGALKQGIFAANTAQNTDAFAHLRTIASGRESTRANSDSMYAIKLQKKQQAAAEAAYKKQQAALQAQLKKIMEQANRGGGGSVPNLPYPGGGGGVPSLPGKGGNGSGEIILPPVVASGQDKRSSDMNQWACDKYGQCPPGYTRRTHITAPEKGESLLDKLKGLF